MKRRDWIVIALLVEQSVLTAVIVADPASLGLPQVAVNWLAILNVAVGVLLNQLKALGSADDD